MQRNRPPTDQADLCNPPISKTCVFIENKRSQQCLSSSPDTELPIHGGSFPRVLYTSVSSPRIISYTYIFTLSYILYILSPYPSVLYILISSPPMLYVFSLHRTLYLCVVSMPISNGEAMLAFLWSAGYMNAHTKYYDALPFSSSSFLGT